jgi:DNA-binding NarL/FixJ family response regulator
VHRLTPRQRQIVQLQGEGLCQKEIAGRLGIALSTVKVHIARSFKRTGSHSGPGLQGQIRAGELRSIASKIKRLLDASNRHVALSRSWPPLLP